MELAEALYVTRATLDSGTCVIVSTLAAPRVESTEARRIYQSAGALMSHFGGLTEEQKERLEAGDEGVFAQSLANVLRLRRPIVIMDEAHNARTPLAFETLARFEPVCVIEFTATPEREHRPPHRFASNVLCHVSSFELKADDMIKMPIHLETHADAREALGMAVRRRAELEDLAETERAATGEYLRPIMLLQAQPKSGQKETLTVEWVREALLRDFGVPAEQVKEATGHRNEIGGLDLSSPNCPVRFIITVQALREGWDCPFAYVLCSVSEVTAEKAVEQILGRIMRLPQAARKGHEELNQAYAYLSSRGVAEAMQRLQDGLVAIGFDRLEAQHIVAGQPALPLQPQLGDELAQRREPCPAERKVAFRVPQLALRAQGLLELCEPEQFLPEDWDLGRCDAALPEREFRVEAPGRGTGTIDAAENGLKVRTSFIAEAQQQVALLEYEAGWSVERLVTWLDRNIPHEDVPQAHSLMFLDGLVGHLLRERDMSLEDLTRHRFRLRDAAAAKIATHRREARHRGQPLLFQTQEVVVGPEVCFSFDATAYPANSWYTGSYQFRKHYYSVVGELADRGEEFDCACAIDESPAVRHWVRNLAHRPRHSFWLPTTTDRFYPDFVAELTDGKYLAVEYKGEYLRTADDAEEKDALGRLWAERSAGSCLFRMVGKEDLGVLRTLLA
jgi:type III restriction enzyme